MPNNIADFEGGKDCDLCGSECQREVYISEEEDVDEKGEIFSTTSVEKGKWFCTNPDCEWEEGMPTGMEDDEEDEDEDLCPGCRLPTDICECTYTDQIDKEED